MSEVLPTYSHFTGILAILCRQIRPRTHHVFHHLIILFPCRIPGHGRKYRLNTLRPRQNGRRFADDNFKRIFLNENVRISMKVSLKFVPKGRINNIPALVPIMAWRRPGDKPLSEPMMVSLLTHTCVTRPQWVNTLGWVTSIKKKFPRVFVLIKKWKLNFLTKWIFHHWKYFPCSLLAKFHPYPF